MRSLRSRSRTKLVFLAGGLVTLVAVGVPFAVAEGAGSRTALGGAKACGVTVKVTDHEQFVVNQYAKDAMRYVPGTATIKSGCDLTFEFATANQDVPHSLSIVNQSDLPRTTAQMQSCEICKQIKAKLIGDPTVPAGPKNPILHWIVNVGKRGLDVPGDSVGIFEAKSKGAPPGHQHVTIRISAPAGKTLYFMCGLHAWMQGKIVVT